MISGLSQLPYSIIIVLFLFLKSYIGTPVVVVEFTLVTDPEWSNMDCCIK